MKTAGLLLASLLMASAAQADDISLGTPGYGGSGCPSDSVSATISPDGKALSLLFDNYIVEAGGDTGKSLDRKTCNVAIPVHVPQGRSVSVLAIDYRGFNQLPRGARSQFNVEYFFAGRSGPAFTKTFNGPVEKDYLISNKLVAESLIWSACGEDVNLRTNSSIRVNTTRKQEAMATVDTQDVKAAIVYQLQWRDCR
ncbi:MULTISPECIES: DUF4360 domain-containing protein [Rhizobium]|jgi:hypothetical protein|uniref:DUF4360 domain-containing protein n=1 Tax=Rhizobium soli TaxID=424798 RepID=A0A7X0JN94_9HYPH|nr:MULTISPECIES: DUF4360 domain-containing protein [Rhizobium]AGU10842.1 protein of unknown function DUF4360 [uncultured organism]RYE69015.1 MAG: DUF4360 domain-containing protein [Rhizobiaceae bacterium]KQQ74969.1 hypothetical protein ASF70_03520 [Rhizobium sp. Leaf321]MBB6510749.1 hypothetical protein [Rhizobium soli]MBD8652899.1 DUF4360 domain-containing protein [Rhizobium sp. CFBP 13726]